jgi:GNAT superfamily N-acetyltransferase
MLESIVDQYFSVYLGYPISQVREGQVISVSCKRRLKPGIGWGYTVTILVHISRQRAIISVRPDLFEALKKVLAEGVTPTELYTLEWRKKIGSLIGSEEIGTLTHVLYCSPKYWRLFRVHGCRRLEDSDVESFVKLKLDLYPECDPECLARDIQRNIKDGIAFGVFQEGKLISVSEAPDIGHMQDLIEEVGVDTHPKYRRRGYGKAVISAMTKAILDIGRIPIYRCDPQNEASVRLAKAIGYKKYADIIEFCQHE